MPTPPKKRLIKFRDTGDYAYVGYKPPHQASSNLIWSSCNTIFNNGKGTFGGNNGAKMSTAFGASKESEELRNLGSNLFKEGVFEIGTIALAPVGIIRALFGLRIAIHAAGIKKMIFSKPCNNKNEGVVF